MDNQITLLNPEELPQTDEPKLKKPKVNCLQDILIEIMNEFGLTDAMVVKGTGIPWSSFHGWVVGDVNCQLADQNLLKLWSFLNKYRPISLQYLLYGIGEDGTDNDEERTA